MARIIGIVSGKGGVGKTTVVSNIGAVLAKRFNKKVTVVDCNFTTAHLGLYLGMYYTPVTLNKVIKGEAELDDAIHHHFTGMKIIPASLSLSDLEGVDISTIKDYIKLLADKNDVILLDSGPGLGRESMACLRACDEVLYVTTPYVPSVIDIVRYEEVVKELGIKSIGIVINMVDKKKHEMSKEEIEQLTGLRVITSISYDTNVKKALAEKLPVVTFRPYTKASKDLHRVAAHIAEYELKEEGFFSKLFNPFRY